LSSSPATARIAPFAFFIALIALQPLLERWLDARWIVLGRGLATGALLLWLWPRFAELRAAPALTARQWAISIAVGVAVFAAWVHLDRPWMAFGSFGTAGFTPLAADGSLDLSLVALRLAILVAIVPVMEELFWRSFLLRWIDRRDFLAADPRRASMLAIAATSLLFAAEHSLWLAGLVAGVAYTSLYVGIGNLRSCLVSHAITNGLLGAWIVATRDWRFW
jgi:CAAX prenyl protease-like protein